MDLHWGQNITKCLEDPDSLLQPCEMPRRAVLFFFFFFCAEHLNPLFQTSGARRGDLHLKEKKRRPSVRESSSHSKYNIQAHSTARRKRSHEIRYILMSLLKGSSSLMLSHNPLRQISIKRVRVSDKTVSMYEQERVNGCYLGLVKSLLFSFFPPKNVFWFTFKICIFIFC